MDKEKQSQGVYKTSSGRRPSIGLVLGSGGARGLAHILVLEVFDEMGLKPDVIAGTSIGAMFGAAYGSGLSASIIREHMHSVLHRRKAVLSRLVANRGAPLRKVLGALALHSAILKPDVVLGLAMPPGIVSNFEDLEIPLHAIATDFHKQSEIVISKGALAPSICASMAIPGVFSPVSFGGKTLVDGGLVNPLPFDVLAEKADIVVAINVSGNEEPGSRLTSLRMMQSLTGALQILQNSIVREKLKSQQPDILIELDVGRFHALDFLKLDEILKAALGVKEELRRKLTRVLGAQTLPRSEGGASVREGENSTPGSGNGRLADRILTGKP